MECGMAEIYVGEIKSGIICQNFPGNFQVVSLGGFSFEKDDIKELMRCETGKICFLQNCLLTFSPFKLIIKTKIFAAIK